MQTLSTFAGIPTPLMATVTALLVCSARHGLVLRRSLQPHTSIPWVRVQRCSSQKTYLAPSIQPDEHYAAAICVYSKPASVDLLPVERVFCSQLFAVIREDEGVSKEPKRSSLKFIASSSGKEDHSIFIFSHVLRANRYLSSSASRSSGTKTWNCERNG